MNFNTSNIDRLRAGEALENPDYGKPKKPHLNELAAVIRETWPRDKREINGYGRYYIGSKGSGTFYITNEQIDLPTIQLSEFFLPEPEFKVGGYARVDMFGENFIERMRDSIGGVFEVLKVNFSDIMLKDGIGELYYDKSACTPVEGPGEKGIWSASGERETVDWGDLKAEVAAPSPPIKGYRLKEECKRYEQAILSIIRGSSADSFILNNSYISVGAKAIELLEAAGVLSLWFSPVYEEVKEQEPRLFTAEEVIERVEKEIEKRFINPVSAEMYIKIITKALETK